MNLNNLKNEIISIRNDEPVFIYVGVGTAKGIVNGEGILEPTNYHQFPPFLQDLRNRIENLNLFLVLIDPRQENPPYLLRDYPALEEVEPDHYANAVGANAIKTNNEGAGAAMQVFVIRESVYTDVDDEPGYPAINITETLRDLNAFAVEKRASLLYHDFSGRRTAALAEYFQHEILNEHLDQIVYSLSAREDHGCYFDLAQLTSYYPIRQVFAEVDMVPYENEVGNRPIVKMFNYYKFFANNSFHLMQEERSKYTGEMQHIIDAQKLQIINDVIHTFKNSQIALLRQLQQIIIGVAEPPKMYDYDQLAPLPSSFPRALNHIYLELMENKEYQLAREILDDFCAHRLDIFARLKQLDLSGQEILMFITANEDPYRWLNNIKFFV
jgi:hypothetical protein